MLAFHSTAALPFLAKEKRPYSIDRFELYNTVLSALLWRRLNGEIIMLADKTAYDYYLDLGIKDVWNDLIEGIPDDFEGIDPIMFWAAGKMLALREVSAPVVMLDTDFIVWKKTEFGDSLIAAHQEDISPGIYPDYTLFRMKDGYVFNPKWKKDVLPLNTAFLYIPNEDFKQYYVNKSIEFMKRTESCDDYLCRMVFAEQRLLALCGEETGYPMTTLLDKDRLFYPQDAFTHLWGAKRVMREDKNAAEDFVCRCKKRILSDFPDYSYILDLLK